MSKFTKPKVAIIHDSVLYMGGAERVFMALLKLYPMADVFTAFITEENRKIVEHYTSGKICISSFNIFPFSHNTASYWKPALFWYWESLDLSSYDLVISSSHSFSAKSVIVLKPAVHVSYIHSPPHYLYDEANEYPWIKKEPFQTMLSPVISRLQEKDFESAQRPDVLIANSKTVQKRIWNYYRKKSTVVYPPVAMPTSSSVRARRQDYYLIVSHLLKQKGVDLAIRACNTLGRRLIIVGSGDQEPALRALAGPTIEFRGFVSDDELHALYASARALLVCSKDEDFGIAPVEAMADGVPVVAYNSGGVRETVVDRKTGILFSDYSVLGLTNAIRRLDQYEWPSGRLRRHAEKFSEKKFMKGMRKIIKDLYE